MYVHTYTYLYLFKYLYIYVSHGNGIKVIRRLQKMSFITCPSASARSSGATRRCV